MKMTMTTIRFQFTHRSPHIVTSLFTNYFRLAVMTIILEIEARKPIDDVELITRDRRLPTKDERVGSLLSHSPALCFTTAT
jgi:hypothetical protein